MVLLKVRREEIQRFLGIIKVRRISDDKFNLIPIREQRKILDAVFFGFPAGRAFDIDNFDTVGIDGGNIEASVGFDHHLVADGKQAVDELGGLQLKKRLSAGHFYQGTAEMSYCLKKFVDFETFAVIIGIGGITVGASKIASGQADKYTRTTAIERFALDAVKYFINPQSHKRFRKNYANNKETDIL